MTKIDSKFETKFYDTRNMMTEADYIHSFTNKRLRDSEISFKYLLHIGLKYQSFKQSCNST